LANLIDWLVEIKANGYDLKGIAGARVACYFCVLNNRTGRRAGQHEGMYFLGCDDVAQQLTSKAVLLAVLVEKELAQGYSVWAGICCIWPG
jgi:hypothetical protein